MPFRPGDAKGEGVQQTMNTVLTCAMAPVGMLYDEHSYVSSEHAIVVIKLTYHRSKAVVPVKAQKAQRWPVVQEVSVPLSCIVSVLSMACGQVLARPSVHIPVCED